MNENYRRTKDFTFTSISKLVTIFYTKIGQPNPFDSLVRHIPKLNTAANSVQVQNELLEQLLVNNTSTLPAILQGMRTITNANTQANRNKVHGQPVEVICQVRPVLPKRSEQHTMLYLWRNWSLCQLLQ